jgi:hypothetical protein
VIPAVASNTPGMDARCERLERIELALRHMARSD